MKRVTRDSSRKWQRWLEEKIRPEVIVIYHNRAHGCRVGPVAGGTALLAIATLALLGRSV